ncbi:uncharacterized protein LOC135950594 [Calliphora vicina]|uniref:uncharacterized protein LOC135950594 n=1 Tax=Calliphora vicina TaxID=7373 RepID=UPI00325C1C28
MGHIKAVNPSDSKATSYYLPHHAVFKPDSLTTKLRVVFNASNPSSNGRIFYRNNPEADIKDYELNTVTFGVNCAPYLAIRTLLQLANDCESQSPLASQILKTQMYVDEVLAGSHKLEDAFERRIELTHVLESAGFVLRKWTANHIRLLEDLPRENLLDADFLKFADASTAKTLGLRWNADTDSFYFRLISQPRRDIVTKRAVLSEIAKLFDPAGWLSPKIIVAKIIMQQIWKDKTDWDESLKTLTLAQWRSFLNDYPNIEKINIPRWVNFHPSHEIELHAFSDASEKAYGCALYVRSISANEITSHSLSAKTKVAPVKSETLPRLELCGAALMENMVESLCKPISSKSNLLTLNPFIDSNGFVRINGRLVRSPGLTYDDRYPKILPYAARFTRLFVEHVYKCSAHGGHSLMLRLVRNEFWAPKLKNLIRTVIFNCKECTIYRKKTGQQIMAPLPPERASLSRPFTHTGLDFAGPFDIKSYIGRGCRITKGYVLVFVCFATKAIHLEATGDMSTETELHLSVLLIYWKLTESSFYSN